MSFIANDVRLPPLKASWSSIVSTVSGTRLEKSHLRWGSINLESDVIFLIPSIQKPSLIEASKGFLLQRGRDTLEGSTLFFEPSKAELRATDISLTRDPFVLRAASLSRSPSAFTLERVSIRDAGDSATPALVLSASRLSHTSKLGVWDISDLSIRVFNAPLLRVRRARIQMGASSSASKATAFKLPVSIRNSSVFGPVVGVAWNVHPARGVDGAFSAERTNGNQNPWYVAFSYDLRRHVETDTLPLAQTESASPRNPLIDFLAEPAVRKQDTSPSIQIGQGIGPRIPDKMSTAVSFVLSTNQEVVRRYQTVLVGMSPQVNVSTSWSNRLFRSEVLVESGQRREVSGSSVQTGFRNMLALRTQGDVLVQGHRVPIEVKYTYVDSHFQYQYLQIAAPIVGRPVGQGLSIMGIFRGASGNALFTSDRLESQSEVQLRWMLRLPGCYFGVGSRYDLVTGRVFDTQFVVTGPGRVIRPELRYRTLGSQIGLTIGLPFFAL